MKQRRVFVWVMALVTAVLLIALFTDALPWLRGPAPDSSIWHWPYQVRPFSRWWPSIAAGTGFLVVLGWWLQAENGGRRQTAAALTLLFISCLGLQWGLLYADRPQPLAELVDRTLAAQTNGYFWTAANLTEINDTLYNYPTAMTQFESDHARTHPPGLVLANWLTLQLMEQSPTVAQQLAKTIYPQRCTDLWLLNQPAATAAGLGIWAILPLILAATAVFPAYTLAKKLSTNPAAAKLASLVAVIPALLIFAPLPDQIFALLTLLIVLTYVNGWQQQKPGWLFLAGFLLSVTTFLSVGNAALLLLLGSYTLLSLWQHPRPLRTIIHPIAIFGLGVTAVWLLYWVIWHVPPWVIVQVGLDEHFALVTTQRSYSTWVRFNLLDLAIFVGVPAIVAFVGATIVAIRKTRGRSLNKAYLLVLSTAVLILLLDLSGSTRGEVGRIWLFFMPLVVICGGVWLADWVTDWRTQWGWAALQVTWAIALGLSWRPMGATIVVAEQPPFPDFPSMSTPLATQFGEQLSLNRVALSQDSETLTLTLEWLAEGPTQRPYTVFNHLINAQGNLVVQADGWAVDGQWPPTCWQAGQAVIDQHQLTLPPDLPPGNYTLLTGLYDARDNSRLLTPTGADHAVTGQITLP